MKSLNNRRSLVFLFYFLFINSFFSYSQGFIKISGTVVDDKTNNPIPSASITIKGNSIGTMSNRNGEYLFNIPDSLKKDTISFSAVGYETYKCLTANIYNKRSNIHLIPHTYNLKEVSIKDKYLTARQILKKVRRNYNKNYKCSPYIADAYYREYTKEDSMYVRAIEVAMSIYNDGSAKRRWNYPAIINGIRLSENYSYETDQAQLYFFHLELNYIDNWTPLTIFSSIRKEDLIIIDTMKYFNGHYVYVIKGASKSKFSAKDLRNIFLKHIARKIMMKMMKMLWIQ